MNTCLSVHVPDWSKKSTIKGKGLHVELPHYLFSKQGQKNVVDLHFLAYVKGAEQSKISTPQSFLSRIER